MKELIERFRTTAYLVMCLLFTILIYLYTDGFITGKSDYFLIGCITVFVIVMVDYLTRRYVKNALLFFGIHLAMIAGVFVLPVTIAEKIILMVTAASYLYLSVGFWRTDLAERSLYVINIPGSLIFMFVLVYLHASFAKEIPTSVATYAYITGIIYMLVFYIREYLDKFSTYSMVNGTHSKEMEGTFLTNMSLIGLFGVISVFGITIANLFFSNSSFNVIGKFLRNIAKILVGWLRPESKPIQETIQETETTKEVVTSIQETTKQVVQTAKRTSSDGIDRTLEIFIVMLFIAVLVSVVIGIYKFIKYYMHKMGRPEDVVEKITYGDEKEREFKKPEEEKRSIFTPNDKKVRKIYREYVKSNIKKNTSLHIQESNTTEEIKDKLQGTVDKNGILALTEVYKKARYSGKDITKEDVAYAKDAAKL